MPGSEQDAVFHDALQGLQRGDFSRLESLFADRAGSPDTRPQIIEWCEQGRFSGKSKELAEALTCACFLGHTRVAEYLLNRGIDPAAGTSTGLAALHWAANRGQLEAVRLLLRHKAPLETRSMYGGTVLGTAVWAAINESRPSHSQIIEELLVAGSCVEEAGYPTGNRLIDELLQRYRKLS